MIKREQLHDMELQAPSYDFIEPEADEQIVSPIKRQIAKIQETASTFTLYDVYKMIGQIDRMIDEKEAEIKKHKDHKELFEAELALIEKALGISDLQKQYDNEVAAEIAVGEALKANQPESTE